jgi:hypothetical protein
MGTYTVHGPHEVFEHAPGVTFDAEIPAGQEALLIASGSLVREDSLESLSRDELDALAESSGVPDPGGLANKTAVIAAINTTREGDD